jgi:hypothetical protein
MQLPNGDRAIVPIEKLHDYCLNPIHRVGGHKAHVFESMLGLTVAHAEVLQQRLLAVARTGEAVLGMQNAYGQRYNVLAFIYGGGRMQAYRVETTVAQDGTLTLSNLPLRAGEAVEVIILVQPSAMRGHQRYPLRGMPVRYIDPTEPVAPADWEAAQ